MRSFTFTGKFRKSGTTVWHVNSDLSVAVWWAEGWWGKVPGLPSAASVCWSKRARSLTSSRMQTGDTEFQSLQPWGKKGQQTRFEALDLFTTTENVLLPEKLLNDKIIKMIMDKILSWNMTMVSLGQHDSV